MIFRANEEGCSEPYPNRKIGSSESYTGVSNSHVPWSRPGVVMDTRKDEPARTGWAKEGIEMEADSHSLIGIGA